MYCKLVLGVVGVACRVAQTVAQGCRCFDAGWGRGSDGATVSGFLREAGLWEEASLMDEPGRLAWAEALVRCGRVLTVFDCAYPTGWLEGLGSLAPPAVWCEGAVGGDRVGVVGSRELPVDCGEWAEALGGWLVSHGRGVVTGGAWGADRRAGQGAFDWGGEEAVVHVLPCGLESGEMSHRGLNGCLVSIFDPRARFSGAQAMVRNRLIYAWSQRTIVVHSRRGVGGTWNGATDALRRGLGQVIAVTQGRGQIGMGSGSYCSGGIPQREPGEEGNRGLIALGAVELEMDYGWSDQLEFLMRKPLERGQLDLFGATVVREAFEGYRVSLTAGSGGMVA
ncbi:hypothetical protein CCB80_00170 [Armatimonadetes bacterium Uphvl-Ar1]|nr:hypothetical protein CCB80_00170 [Armatimonadetes bacterium Uphvl-Ar1]